MIAKKDQLQLQLNKNCKQKNSWKISRLLVFASIFIFMISGAFATSLTDGLVSYYSFDSDNVLDEYGSFDLTNVGTTNITGILGSARNGDGSSNYMYRSLSSSYLNPTNFTLTFWAKRDTTTTHDNIFGGWGVSNTILTRFTNTANGLDNYIYTTGTDGGAVSGISSDTSWNFYVVKFDGNRLYFYQNGNVLQNVTTTSGTINLRSDFCILAYAGATSCTSTPGNFFDGQFDEFGVYNRSLSQIEIDSLYNSGTGLNPLTAATTPTINHNISNYYNSENISISLNTTTNSNYSYVLDLGSEIGILNDTNSTTLNLYNLSEGIHNITLISTDTNGQANTTANFTIDLTNPVISIIGPIVQDFLVNFSEVFNVTDALSGLASCTLNATYLENVTNASQYDRFSNCTDSVSFGAAGVYQGYLEAIDNAGNIETLTLNGTIQPFVYVNFFLENGSAITNYNPTLYHPDGQIDYIINTSNPVNISPYHNGSLDLGNYTIQFYKQGYVTQNFSVPINETSGGITYNFTISQATLHILIYDRETEVLLTGSTNIEIQGPVGYNGSTTTGNITIQDVAFTEGTYRIIATHSNFGTEEYPFIFTNRENSTINIYMLNTTPTENQVQEIIVRNENNYLIDGGYVYLEAWKPAESKYELRSIGISNGQGKVYFNVEVGSVLYRISGVYGERVGSLTPAVIYDTTTALTLPLSLNQTPITQVLENFQGSFTENVSGNYSYLRFQFQDSDNLVSQACIKIYRFGPRELLNSTCSSAASGILYFTLDINRSYSMEALAFVTLDGQEEQIGEGFYYNSFHQLDFKGLEWILPVVILFAAIALGLWLETPYLIALGIIAAYIVNWKAFKDIYSVNIVVIIILIMGLTWWASTRKGD